MFKKVFLILFILIEIHAFTPTLLQTVGFTPHSYQNHVFAAGTGISKFTQKVEPAWSSYILPGTVGAILIAGIGSYWLVYRRKHS